MRMIMMIIANWTEILETIGTLRHVLHVRWRMSSVVHLDYYRIYRYTGWRPVTFPESDS